MSIVNKPNYRVWFQLEQQGHREQNVEAQGSTAQVMKHKKSHTDYRQNMTSHVMSKQTTFYCVWYVLDWTVTKATIFVPLKKVGHGLAFVI